MKQTSGLITLILATVSPLVFCAVGEAQQRELARASISLGDGYLFINNASDKSLTVEIKSKQIEPITTGNNPAFKVDGRIVQIVIVQIEKFLGSVKNTDDEKKLELHQSWERGYLENDIYDVKLHIESEKLSLKERAMLFWGFTRPSLTEEYDRDYFLTTIIGDRLLGLSSPIRKGESVSDYKKLFIDILSTLKISDKPFDIEKLADQIKKGTYKGN